MKNYIECRDCGEEFDPDSPEHSKIGFYNQCCECADPADELIKKKAFIGRTDENDFMGIEIVSGEEFEKYKKVVEAYGDVEGNDSVS